MHHVILFLIDQQLDSVSWFMLSNAVILEKCSTTVCEQLWAAYLPNQNK